MRTTSTSESTKRIDIMRTPPQTSQPQRTQETPTEATRKSTPHRQATLTITLGNPIPKNGEDQKTFSIESQGKRVEKEKQPSSLSSFIHEMGFKQNSPEFFACICSLETIKPINRLPYFFLTNEDRKRC